MNKIKIFSLMMALLVSSIMAYAATPKINFEQKTFDMGTIKAEDGKVAHEFEFTNKGDAPLVIKTAYGSCDCTVPTFPLEPIAPGQKATIKIEYDPSSKAGEVHSTVTVVSNDREHKRVKLLISGVVLPKKSK